MTRGRLAGATALAIALLVPTDGIAAGSKLCNRECSAIYGQSKPREPGCSQTKYRSVVKGGAVRKVPYTDTACAEKHRAYRGLLASWQSLASRRDVFRNKAGCLTWCAEVSRLRRGADAEATSCTTQPGGNRQGGVFANLLQGCVLPAGLGKSKALHTVPMYTLGQISVRVEPPGARVSVNGRVVSEGKVGPMALKSGSLEVILDHSRTKEVKAKLSHHGAEIVLKQQGRDDKVKGRTKRRRYTLTGSPQIHAGVPFVLNLRDTARRDTGKVLSWSLSLSLSDGQQMTLAYSTPKKIPDNASSGVDTQATGGRLVGGAMQLGSAPAPGSPEHGHMARGILSGRYEILVEKPGHRSERRTVHVAVGEHQKVEISLPEVVGSLVATVPGRAALLVDGEEVARGSGTLRADRVLIGQHQVTIQAAGWVTWHAKLLVEEGKETAVAFPADAGGAVLECTSPEAGAIVWLDGIYIGQTPIRKAGVKPGRHSVRFKPGETVQITVDADDDEVSVSPPYRFDFTDGFGGSLVPITYFKSEGPDGAGGYHGLGYWFDWAMGFNGKYSIGMFENLRIYMRDIEGTDGYGTEKVGNFFGVTLGRYKISGTTSRRTSDKVRLLVTKLDLVLGAEYRPSLVPDPDDLPYNDAHVLDPDRDTYAEGQWGLTAGVRAAVQLSYLVEIYGMVLKSSLSPFTWQVGANVFRY